MTMKKGQVSSEFLLTLAIMMLVFLFLLVIVFEKNIETKEMERNLDKAVECRKFASLLESFNVASDGTEMLLTTRKRIVVNESFLEVLPINGSVKDEGIGCKFQGYISYYNVTGDLRLKKKNGAIIIQNA